MTALGAALERARAVDLLELAQRYVTLKRVSATEWAGPCPQCAGHDRFSVNTKKRVFNCRGCLAKGKGAIGFLMFAERCDFRSALERLEGPLPATPAKGSQTVSSNGPSDDDLLRSAARIVAELRPLAGTAGERYLRDVRRIDCDAIPDVLAEPYAIGWHPGVFFRETGHPLDGQRLGTIVAILTDPVTAKPTGAISRTYIHDGAKVAKAKLLAGSGIVRLSKDEDVLEALHIAEGLESALTGMAAGFRPMWSAGSTSQFRSFPVLAGVTRLTIFADHDANGAGEVAARATQARWLAGGRKARILMRAEIGDLNDVGRAAP